MKLKTKLCSTIVMFCLTIVTLMVGVWAVKSANVNIGGTLSFVAQGIEATISQGTMTNGTWQTASHATSKLKQIEITKQDTTSTLATKFSSWSGINLNFNENADDITISFSIKNNSDTNSIAVEVSTAYASATNCTIAIDTSSANIAPNASQNFTLTMKITDKDINASMTNFTVIFNMQHVQPAPPVDAEEVSYLTFTYNDTDMTAELSACSSNAPTEVVVPERVIYNGKEYTVTTLAVNYDGIEYASVFAYISVTSVTIPGTIETVPDHAFLYSSVTNVVLQEGVKRIGENALYQVQNISIPDSIQEINSYCFGYFDEYLSYGTLYNNLYYLGSTSNQYLVLLRASSTDIKSCTINAKCKLIWYNSFKGCNSLTSITIPNNVTNIGNDAFNGCTGLTSITIPDSVTSIGNQAFANCTGLTSITIGNGVTSIGVFAFTGCTGLTSITIGNGVTSIGMYAFYGCTGLTSITIGNGVTSIGAAAFSGCTNLTYNTYDNAKYLGNSTNKYIALIEATSTSITSCTINSGCKFILGYAFQNCTGLTSITIPDSVTSIGHDAFYGCTSLTSITIPNSVTSIGDSAFQGCTKLAEVNINATSVPTGGYSMFYNCSSSLVIYVPTASVSAYKAASGWSTYSTKIQGKSF